MPGPSQTNTFLADVSKGLDAIDQKMQGIASRAQQMNASLVGMKSGVPEGAALPGVTGMATPATSRVSQVAATYMGMHAGLEMEIPEDILKERAEIERREALIANAREQRKASPAFAKYKSDLDRRKLEHETRVATRAFEQVAIPALLGISEGASDEETLKQLQKVTTYQERQAYAVQGTGKLQEFMSRMAAKDVDPTNLLGKKFHTPEEKFRASQAAALGGPLAVQYDLVETAKQQQTLRNMNIPGLAARAETAAKSEDILTKQLGLQMKELLNGIQLANRELVNALEHSAEVTKDNTKTQEEKGEAEAKVKEATKNLADKLTQAKETGKVLGGPEGGEPGGPQWMKIAEKIGQVAVGAASLAGGAYIAYKTGEAATYQEILGKEGAYQENLIATKGLAEQRQVESYDLTNPRNMLKYRGDILFPGQTTFLGESGRQNALRLAWQEEQDRLNMTRAQYQRGTAGAITGAVGGVGQAALGALAVTGGGLLGAGIGGGAVGQGLGQISNAMTGYTQLLGTNQYSQLQGGLAGTIAGDIYLGQDATRRATLNQMAESMAIQARVQQRVNDLQNLETEQRKKDLILLQNMQDFQKMQQEGAILVGPKAVTRDIVMNELYGGPVTDIEKLRRPYSAFGETFKNINDPTAIAIATAETGPIADLKNERAKRNRDRALIQNAREEQANRPGAFTTFLSGAAKGVVGGISAGYNKVALDYTSSVPVNLMKAVWNDTVGVVGGVIGGMAGLGIIPITGMNEVDKQKEIAKQSEIATTQLQANTKGSAERSKLLAKGVPVDVVNAINADTENKNDMILATAKEYQIQSLSTEQREKLVAMGVPAEALNKFKTDVEVKNERIRETASAKQAVDFGQLQEATQRIADQSSPVVDLNRLVMPTGPVTSRYGWRKSPIAGASAFHAGVDYGVPTGTAVKAAAKGYISNVFTTKAGGQQIEVTYPDLDLKTSFAHLSKTIMKQGDEVEQGQIIALSGNSGTATTGAHLHMAMRRASDNALINPLTGRMAATSVSLPQISQELGERETVASRLGMTPVQFGAHQNMVTNVLYERATARQTADMIEMGRSGLGNFQTLLSNVGAINQVAGGRDNIETLKSVLSSAVAVGFDTSRTAQQFVQTTLNVADSLRLTRLDRVAGALQTAATLTSATVGAPDERGLRIAAEGTRGFQQFFGTQEGVTGAGKFLGLISRGADIRQTQLLKDVTPMEATELSTMIEENKLTNPKARALLGTMGYYKEGVTEAQQADIRKRAAGMLGAIPESAANIISGFYNVAVPGGDFKKELDTLKAAAKAAPGGALKAGDKRVQDFYSNVAGAMAGTPMGFNEVAAGATWILQNNSILSADEGRKALNDKISQSQAIFNDPAQIRMSRFVGEIVRRGGGGMTMGRNLDKIIDVYGSALKSGVPAIPTASGVPITQELLDVARRGGTALTPEIKKRYGMDEKMTAGELRGQIEETMKDKSSYDFAKMMEASVAEDAQPVRIINATDIALAIERARHGAPEQPINPSDLSGWFANAPTTKGPK